MRGKNVRWPTVGVGTGTVNRMQTIRSQEIPHRVNENIFLSQIHPFPSLYRESSDNINDTA